MVKNASLTLHLKMKLMLSVYLLTYISTDLHQYNIFIDFTARKNYYDPPVSPT